MLDRIAGAIGYLKASITDAGDRFGTAIAMSADGDTLAVGALEEDGNGTNGNQADNSASNAGAVYVYVRAATGWTQQAYVKASNTDAGDDFSRSLALSGDGRTLAVGAPYESSAATGVNGSVGPAATHRCPDARIGFLPGRVAAAAQGSVST